MKQNNNIKVYRKADIAQEMTKVVAEKIQQGYAITIGDNWCGGNYNKYTALFKGNVYCIIGIITNCKRGNNMVSIVSDEFVMNREEAKRFVFENKHPFYFGDNDRTKRTEYGVYYEYGYGRNVYYVDEQGLNDIKALRRVRDEREFALSHNHSNGKSYFDDLRMFKAVLPLVQRQRGFKTVHLEDITSIRRFRNKNTTEWVVFIKNKSRNASFTINKR